MTVTPTSRLAARPRASERTTTAARANLFAAAVTVYGVVLATPAFAIDGEILINQSKVAAGISTSDAAGFPATLGQSGRYKLTGNLSVPAGVNGIEITVGDVTLDLNGFTISSNPPGDAYRGVFAPGDANQVRISNGTITGFRFFGILGLGMHYVVEDMRIVGNSVGMTLGSESRVRSSTIANNSSVGMYCAACVIEGNLIAGNAGVGVADNTTGVGLVLGNAIVGNGLVDPRMPMATAGYGNNILFDNHNGGGQMLGVRQLHPNFCTPACP
jgi:hypothetical protein